jgi:tetratricopeptide (TPR) repeat protein
MAPEQHAGAPADPRSDVYAFAVTAWEALLGSAPFSTDTQTSTTIDGTTAHAVPRLGTPSRSTPHAIAELVEAKRAGPPSIPADTRDVPPAVLDTLRRAMHPDPEARVASMAELLAALAPPPRGRSGGLWILGLGAVAIAGALALGMRSEDDAIDTRCTASAGELASVWDADRRAEVQAAAQRLGSGWPAPERVLERIDLYAGTWADMHRANCEATTIRAQQSERDMDLRTRCLLRARAELDATVDLLGAADVEIARRAHEMVGQLPSIERCGDVVAIESAELRPEDPELDAAVEAVREKLAPAHALERAGRYPEAHAILEPLAEEAEAIGFLPLVAEMGPVWGHVLERTNHGAEAEAAWRRAVEIGVEHGPPGPASRCAGMLVSHLTAQDARFAEAEAWASMGVSLARRAGRGTPAEAYALNRRGGLHLERAQLDAAERDYEEALAIYERVRGPDHPDIGLALTSLGRVHDQRGDLDEAEALHVRAHDVLASAFGPEHPEVAVALSNIGTVREARGDYEGALAHHLKALDIVLPVLGPEHIELAMLYTNIGVCENNLGRLDDAEATHRKALAIVEKAHGPSHVEVGRILINIGVIELRRLDFAAAETTLARSVQILEAELGDAHPHTTSTMMNLAIAMASQGRRVDALEIFRRILAIRERELDPQHPAIASILGNLGHLEMEEGRYDDAKAHFQRALAIREAKGAEPKDRAFETFGLARALYMTGEKSRGLELANEALEIWAAAGPGFASQRDEAKAWVDQETRNQGR